MILLSIFDSGAAWWVISLAYIGLMIWFYINYKKVRKAGYVIDAKQGDGKGVTYDPTKVKAKSIAFLWYGVALTVFYLVFLFALRSDYRPYNAKKDGVPQIQTDTTREAAEDMIKK